MTKNIEEIKVKKEKWGISINVLGILFTIIFSTVYLFAFHYLDYEVLSPLLLPKDYCYYHIHDVPWWVELFYMTPAGNGHPDGSFFHLLLLIIIAVFAGYRTSSAIMNKLIADNNK